MTVIMMLRQLTLLTTFCLCLVQAVLSGKDFKRREARVESYGLPARPAPKYGPPSIHTPHFEYGVPQKIPFQEYGPSALKYSPPRLNFLDGDSSPISGLHEQVKTHFGVPKPFYGPPHIQNKPSPPKPGYSEVQQYSQLPPQYGLPPQPAPRYGVPPLKLQHRPAPQYGLPPPQHHIVSLASPQLLPALQPAPLFNPAHQPATSYGPPASGPLNLQPKLVYDIPSNYGPPPLPVNLPGPQTTGFNRVPETTVILSGQGSHQPPRASIGGPIKQVQIQIDASGHTHSVSGSQAPFHTACDGWKPIQAPIGAYIEHNNIDTHGGFTNINHGHIQTQNLGTQYRLSEASSVVNGLSDEQLVAVALQGEAGNIISGSGDNSHLNTVDSKPLQLPLASLDDSYSKPPRDSFAPDKVHSYKYQTINTSPESVIPLTPQPEPHAALINSQPQSQSNIQYDTPSENSPQFSQDGANQPNKPVVYRPSVPTGFLESIGATVQHLDQFGVKPPQQPPTYIPPAAHEIAISSPPAPIQALYGTPPNQPAPPQIIAHQQLPQPQPGTAFNLKKPVFLQQYGPPAHQYPAVSPQPLFLQHQQNQQHMENSYSASHYIQQFVRSQGLPLVQQAPRFNQQSVLAPGRHFHQQLQPLIVHNCGHGPNLISSTGYQVQQPQIRGAPAPITDAYNGIAQSIPVAEHHTQFLAGPADSYLPPPSGNEIGFDHFGHASQKLAVAALPDGTDLQQLQGQDHLNVISAPKSHSIQLGSNAAQSTEDFQVHFDSSLNNAVISSSGNAPGEQSSNHEEILSQGLLQSILTAIEQPQASSIVPQNHKAQSRSDGLNHDDIKQQMDDVEIRQEQLHNASNHVEVHVLSDANASEENVHSKIKEIDPIVAAEVGEDLKH